MTVTLNKWLQATPQSAARFDVPSAPSAAPARLNHGVTDQRGSGINALTVSEFKASNGGNVSIFASR